MVLTCPSFPWLFCFAKEKPPKLLISIPTERRKPLEKQEKRPIQSTKEIQTIKGKEGQGV